ncbi:MAG: glutamine--fructose-6-phosphate transaminase (isomerizing) [Oscillospiraceae bacterium]|jgi:glucosamine--fructose-6-phosphate aminotransferase (isomerizing)|nr:glutamine--fructose-6-phosphate transaminase (isomerizing) [Oscillospiraceae bacterium]
MCGIFGYIGEKDALPILLDGLKRLEYRGYDSSGVALMEDGTLTVRKARGRLTNLEARLADQPVSGHTGIGHTRWATHGGPTDENAHPHMDNAERFAVVHNGIIENHAELRGWLEREGYVFHSQTDTEVVAHLLAHCWKGDLREAVQDTVAYLKGSFALCVLCRDIPGTICCTRLDSPLVIGLADGEQFIASDIPALLPHTREVILLNDRELALVTADGCVCFNAFGQKIDKEVQTIEWKQESADLGGYPHFMLKEIHEQPAALQALLDACVEEQNGKLRFHKGAMPVEPEAARAAGRVLLVGCGSAYHAAAVGERAIEAWTRLPVEIDIASEFRYRDPIIRPDDLCVFISQSGETADTLAALRLASKTARTMGIVNAVGSTLSREADGVLYTHAGPEIAVATTKGYTTQVMALLLLGLYLASARGQMDDEALSTALKGLMETPARAGSLLQNIGAIQRFASENADQRSVFYIGRGMDYALSMEASLKLKEITYAHSEAYAAGELKHGTIALIEPGTLVVALATQPDLVDKTLSNIIEVKARGAKILTLTTVSLQARMEEVSDTLWAIPDCEAVSLPCLGILPMQLMAYYVALARGCDVDKPRNLAKSVTVE